MKHPKKHLSDGTKPTTLACQTPINLPIVTVDISKHTYSNTGA